MVEAKGQQVDRQRQVQLIESVRRILPNHEEAFRLCRGEFPQVAEDSRLFITKLPEIFPEFWTQAYSRMEASDLINLIAEADKRNDVIDEIGRVYSSGELSGKIALFNAVYKVTREYLRPPRAHGGTK